MRAVSLGICAAALLLSLSPAHAASVNLLPTADGDVSIFGGTSIDTTDDVVSLLQSGNSNIRNGVLEFDLTSISDAATLTSATLTIIHDGFLSNTGGNPVQLDVFAYAGNGTVDVADFSAAGTQVVDSSIALGQPDGTALSFAFSSVAPLQSLLATNLLTLRLETDSFASFQFASLESNEFAAASLEINFDVNQVPLPAALPLLGTALAALGLFRWRRKRMAA